MKSILLLTINRARIETDYISEIATSVCRILQKELIDTLQSTMITNGPPVLML